MLSSLIQKIPPSRIALYLTLLGFIPLIFCGIEIFNSFKKLNALEEAIEHTKQQVMLKEKKQQSNQMVRNFYQEADHQYIDKQLETLQLLQSESSALEKILNSQAFTGHPSIERRYEFLTHNENHLRFVESAIQKGEGIRETQETLAHPVEIDEQDLTDLLFRIEGIPMNSSHTPLLSPQFLITDFKLTRKTTTENNESFVLNLKIIKREFL